MNAIEKWLNRIYRPRPASWKRPALFMMSLLILVACSLVFVFVSGMPAAFWVLFGLLFAFGVAGMFTAVFGSDFWVALILGSP